jgi:hypothetical protein
MWVIKIPRYPFNTNLQIYIYNSELTHTVVQELQYSYMDIHLNTICTA